MPTKVFNIALPRQLVKRVDRAAEKEYRNRSELIREALRTYLQDLDEWQGIFRAGRKAVKRLNIKSAKEIDRIVYKFRHGKKIRKSRS